MAPVRNRINTNAESDRRVPETAFIGLAVFH